MSFRSVTFPITLARPIDRMILGARMAVADILRREARDAVSRASDAGVDGLSVGRNLVMQYMTACRASRFLRGFPGAVARWCFQVEQHAPQFASEGYPVAPALSVGGYGMEWISSMPGNMVLIRAGGINASGALPEGATLVMHEVREVRLTETRDLDGATVYQCTIIMSADTGPREMHEDPVDGQPLVMEPEDQ